MSKVPVQVIALDDDVLNPKVAVSCLDFLLIELVPLAQRMAEQLQAREEALLREFRQSRIFNNRDKVHGSNATIDGGSAAGAGSSARDSTITGVSSLGVTASTVAGGATNASGMSDEIRDAVLWRLDNLGYRVGQGLVERFSVNKPRPQTPLDAIKFICKDLWILLFRKQIDNLKTNHRGVFVLTDNRFQPLSRMSVDRRGGPKAAEDALGKAQTFLYFPCGVIRGALASLGIEVTITAETAEIPAAIFQIKTKGAKA
jgi:hypothetical protein